MKIGEVKIQALILMRAHIENGPQDISVTDLPTLMGMEAYGEYLIGMTGALNRCLADLENKRVLPVRAAVLPPTDAVAGFCRYDTADFTDLRQIERVVYSNTDGVYASVSDYRTEGQLLVLPAIDIKRETYTLIYRPRLTRVTTFTDDEAELDVPDHIAELIPYFLKSELYREDEPAEADAARAIYEKGLAELDVGNERCQTSVESIYVSEAW